MTVSLVILSPATKLYDWDEQVSSTAQHSTAGDSGSTGRWLHQGDTPSYRRGKKESPNKSDLEKGNATETVIIRQLEGYLDIEHID